MPSIAEIADRVARSDRHVEVERLVAELRARREATRAKINRLIAGRRDAVVDREILTLGADADQLDAELRVLRAELRDLRAEHGARVAAALATIRQDIASRIVDALAEASRLQRDLAETEVAIEAAGGHATRMPPLGVQMEGIARAIAGRPWGG